MTERIPRLVRRRHFTSPVRPGQLFNVSIDLIEVVEEASAPGGELDECPLAAELRLREILHQYELALDDFIVSGLARRRPQRDDLPITTRADPEWKDNKRRQARKVAARYEILQGGALQVAALLEEQVSVGAAEQWADRFHATVFPIIFQDCGVDGVLPWLRANSDHTDDQLAYVELLYRQYLVQRRILRHDAVAATVDVMRSHFIPDPVRPPRADLRYARKLHAISELGEDTVEMMRSCLMPRQQRSLDAAILQRTRLGPPVDTRLLAHLDEN